MEMRNGKTFNFWATLGLDALILVVVAINFSGATSIGQDLGLFMSTNAAQSAKFETFITPAGYAFSIWSFIYLWLIVSGGFFVATLFGPAPNGGKTYMNPEVVTGPFLIVLLLNLVFNICWLFFFDREWLVVSGIALWSIAATGILSAALLALSITKYEDMRHNGQGIVYWMHVVFPLNGLAAYATWCVVASLINSVIVVHYVFGVGMEFCCYLALAILAVVMVLWAATENFVKDYQARFVFTPFLVVIWALVAVSVNKESEVLVPQLLKDLVKVLIGLAVVLLIVRIVLFVVKTKKNSFRTAYT